MDEAGTGKAGPRPFALVVVDTGGCGLLEPGARWVVEGGEIRAVGRARICLPALWSMEAAIREGGCAPGTRLGCGEPGCGAAFRLEAVTERRHRGEGPPDGLERRQAHLAMAAGALLREQGPFLSLLSSSLVEELRRRGSRIVYPAGATILPEDARADRLLLVDEGEVEVSRRSERDGTTSLIAVLGKGECFGEMSLLTGERTSASVTARGETVVLSLAHPVIEDLLERSPELNRAFSRILAARLRAQNISLQSELGRGILGKLSTMSPVDLVQTLRSSRLSGTLVLTGQRQEGRMGFRDGEVVSATLGSLAGEEAFHALLAWKRGEFCFEPGGVDAPAQARIEADTLGLILESMRRLDEAGLRAGEPAPGHEPRGGGGGRGG